MGSPRFVAIPLLGVAAVLAIVTIFTPWWTLKMELSDQFREDNDVSDSDIPDPVSAKPFDEGEPDEKWNAPDDARMIGSTQALVAGLIVVASILSFGAAAGLVAVPPKPGKSALQIAGGSIGLGGALLLALAAILAVTTWPNSTTDEDANDAGAGDALASEDVGFWDETEVPGFDGVTLKVFGNFGWYIVLAGALVGAIGGGISFLRPGTAGAPMPPPGYGTWYGPQGGVRPAQPAPPAYGYPAQRPPQAPWAPPPAPQQAAAYPPAPPVPQQSPWAPPGQQQPPPAAPPPGWGPQAQPQPAAKLVQCPRCGTRVQAPGFRPVDLVCPSCRFTARLES